MRKEARRATPVSEWPSHVREIYTHILASTHNTTSLAKASGRSAPTVARSLQTLRRLLGQQGDELVSVRSHSRWHYEIRINEAEWNASWERFRAMCGSIRVAKRVPDEDPDVAANT